MNYVRIYCDSNFNCYEPYLAWEGDVTQRQTKRLVDFCSRYILDMKIMGCGCTTKEKPQTPLRKILIEIIMKELELYREGYSSLLEEGAENYEYLLNLMTGHTKFEGLGIEDKDELPF